VKTLCIWGETRADVLDGYRQADQMEEPHRLTWRLAAAFTGEPVGDVCLAPNHPEIRDAYSDDVLEVEVIPQEVEVAVYEDDVEIEVELEDDDE